MPELLVERLRADGVSVESVFPREAFESFVADPEPRSSIAALLRGGNTEIHLVDEPVPCYIARHGDRAVFDLPSDTGGPVVRFTTGRRAVVDWVDSTIDGFRDRAETLAVEDLVD
jgi:hypothetical protein